MKFSNINHLKHTNTLWKNSSHWTIIPSSHQYLSNRLSTIYYKHTNHKSYPFVRDIVSLIYTYIRKKLDCNAYPGVFLCIHNLLSQEVTSLVSMLVIIDSNYPGFTKFISIFSNTHDQQRCFWWRGGIWSAKK